MCARAHITAPVHCHTFSQTITKSCIDLAKFSQPSQFQNFHRKCSSVSQKEGCKCKKTCSWWKPNFLCLLIHAKRKEKRKRKYASTVKNKSHHLAWQHRLQESSGLVNPTCNRTHTYNQAKLRADRIESNMLALSWFWSYLPKHPVREEYGSQ